MWKIIYFVISNTITSCFGRSCITIGPLMLCFLLFQFGLKCSIIWIQIVRIFAMDLGRHRYRRVRWHSDSKMEVNFTMNLIWPKIFEIINYFGSFLSIDDMKTHTFCWKCFSSWIASILVWFGHFPLHFSASRWHSIQ